MSQNLETVGNWPWGRGWGMSRWQWRATPRGPTGRSKCKVYFLWQRLKIVVFVNNMAPCGCRCALTWSAMLLCNARFDCNTGNRLHTFAKGFLYIKMTGFVKTYTALFIWLRRLFDCCASFVLCFVGCQRQLAMCCIGSRGRSDLEHVLWHWCWAEFVVAHHWVKSFCRNFQIWLKL